MDSQQDQIIYLAAAYTAAHQVNQLAHTGEVNEEVLECLINSLLTIDPPNALAVYGGSDVLLRSGYQLMVNMLNKNIDRKENALQYTAMMLLLESSVISNEQMMRTIGDRLSLIRTKVEHFGVLDNNVIEACAELYGDTISKLPRRIMVRGDANILQRRGVAEKIRTLLLAGIRAVMQWQYVGGKHWRFALLRRQTLAPAVERLELIKRRL